MQIIYIRPRHTATRTYSFQYVCNDLMLFCRSNEKHMFHKFWYKHRSMKFTKMALSSLNTNIQNLITWERTETNCNRLHRSPGIGRQLTNNTLNIFVSIGKSMFNLNVTILRLRCYRFEATSCRLEVIQYCSIRLNGTSDINSLETINKWSIWCIVNRYWRIVFGFVVIFCLAEATDMTLTSALATCLLLTLKLPNQMGIKQHPQQQQQSNHQKNNYHFSSWLTVVRNTIIERPTLGYPFRFSRCIRQIQNICSYKTVYNLYA